jgi:hypothetical protein
MNAEQMAFLAARFPLQQRDMNSRRDKHERAGDHGDGSKHHRLRERINRMAHVRKRPRGNQRRSLRWVDTHAPCPPHFFPANDRKPEARPRDRQRRPRDRRVRIKRPQKTWRIARKRRQKRMHHPQYNRRRPNHAEHSPELLARHQIRRPAGSPARLVGHPKHAPPIGREHQSEQKRRNALHHRAAVMRGDPRRVKAGPLPAMNSPCTNKCGTAAPRL